MAAPEPGREYPIKLGASMFNTGNGANAGVGGGDGKAYFACHAAHMPEASASAGALLRQDDQLSLRVPTTSSGDTGVRLTGTRRHPSSNAMSEYVFEFRDGVIYVERITDSFANMRAQPGEVTISPPSPRTPTPGTSLAPAKTITKKRRTPSPPTRPAIAVKSVGAKTVPRTHPDASASSSDSGSGSDSGSASGSDSDSDSGSGESSDNDSVSYTSRSSDGE